MNSAWEQSYNERLVRFREEIQQQHPGLSGSMHVRSVGYASMLHPSFTAYSLAFSSSLHDIARGTAEQSYYLNKTSGYALEGSQFQVRGLQSIEEPNLIAQNAAQKSLEAENAQNYHMRRDLQCYLYQKELQIYQLYQVLDVQRKHSAQLLEENHELYRQVAAQQYRIAYLELLMPGPPNSGLDYAMGASQTSCVGKAEEQSIKSEKKAQNDGFSVVKVRSVRIPRQEERYSEPQRGSSIFENSVGTFVEECR